MIFIGAGTLLRRAVLFAKNSGLAVDLVCCPLGDPSLLALRRHGIRLVETNNPSRDLLPMLDQSDDRVGFSINNKHVLSDDILSAGTSFFNVHSGLVQRYRGRAEVCIFASLCKGERIYGVTLHRILPCQRVDSGPVVSQLEFEIGDNDGFCNVLSNAMESCQRIFESNVGQVLSGRYPTIAVEVAGEAYTYKHIVALCRDVDSHRFSKACDWGPYAEFFPRLQAAVESVRQLVAD